MLFGREPAPAYRARAIRAKREARCGGLNSWGQPRSVFPNGESLNWELVAPIPLPMAERKGSVHRAGEIAGRFGRIVHLFSKSIQRSGPKQHRRVGTIAKWN